MRAGERMYQFPEDLKRAYESSPISFVYYEPVEGNAVPVLASQGFCDNVGMSREAVLQWLSTGMFERMHPDDVGLVSKISKEFLEKLGQYDVTFRCRIAGTYAYIHGVGKWQRMPDGTELAVVSYTNITGDKERLQTMSEEYGMFQRDRFYTDPVTGLPNINYLNEYGAERIRVMRAHNIVPVLLYADVYSMQSYNSQYGVAEGDELLRLVASTLREQFPRALVTRGADDHFVVIAELNSRTELVRQLTGTNELLRKNAHGNTSGISAGICPVEETMALSEALDHAKQAHKQLSNDLSHPYVFFSHEADEAYWQSRYIIENFDEALARGWIRVFYQGIYRLETQKVAAFEALARWVDPERGTITPGVFIPVLREYHLLHKLDLYILEQVFKEVPVRVENDLPLVPVSVNFSRQDFDHVDVVSAMNALYEKHGVAQYADKSFFIVEITEQEVAEGIEGFRDQLRRIRENGYRLWLDDFGSGYSAINVLSQFEFDLVKFDLEMLRHLDDNGGVNRLILKALVRLAWELGIHTLVEGVETREQHKFLQSIGCELVQGFHYYRPEPLNGILYRIRGGMKIKPCETTEERESFYRRWRGEEKTEE